MASTEIAYAMRVAAASESVGETIVPRTKAASQRRPGGGTCAAAAKRHALWTFDSGQ